MPGDHIGTESLVSFFEGRATGGERAAIERHAAACDSCRQLLSALARSTAPASPAARAARGSALPKRVGRYVVEYELGAGAMGVVYAARDPELDRAVAVKLLHAGGDATQDRLRREAKAMAQLAHPNVVTVFDVGAFGDQLFVAMELVDGEPLSRWLEAPAPRDVAAILDAFAAAGRGLAAAHTAGIVHRDFKPDNVLVGRDGRVRVADFGLARSESARDAAPGVVAVGSSLTQTGAVVGTPYYMAPELYKGGAATPRSDQFAFCVALFAALHGELPFEGATFEALALAIGGGELGTPAKPRGSRRVRAAIARGLANDPDARWRDMTELLDALAPRRRAWLAPTIVGGAVIAACAVAAIAIVGPGTATDVPCADASGLGAVWTPPRRLAVTTGLVASGAPYAATSAREVARLVDQYAIDWQQQRVLACVDGRRAEPAAAGRVACLDERRRELDAALGALGPKAVVHAVDAIATLPPVADCAEAIDDAGADPLRAGIARELRGALAEIDAVRATGAAASQIAPANAVLAAARSLHDPALEARAAIALGRLDAAAGHYDRAAARDADAAALADSAHADPLAARAVLDELMRYYDLEQHAQVPALAARAQTLLDRLGRPAALVGELAFVRSELEYDDNDLIAAQRDADAAVTAAEKHEADDYLQIEPLRTRAAIESRRADGDHARPDLERAIAIQRRTLGDAHPDLAETFAFLAAAAVEQRRHADAIALYHEVEARYAALEGPSSTRVTDALCDEAAELVAIGRGTDGLAKLQQAIDSSRRARGDGDRFTLDYTARYGEALRGAGRPADALAVLVPLLARERAALGPGKNVAAALRSIANAELAVGKPRDARDHAQAAYDMLAQVYGASYRPFDELLAIGRADLALGEPGSAVGVLEHAMTDAADADPASIAWCNALLGRALYDAGRDRARGLELASTAYAVLAADPRGARDAAELRAWAKSRGIEIAR